MPLEAVAREIIDRLLQAAGWHVCDVARTNLHAARGKRAMGWPDRAMSSVVTRTRPYGSVLQSTIESIETFDIIVTDEAHRFIYNVWAQVMKYNHEMAVADGVNLNFRRNPHPDLRANGGGRILSAARIQ